ncbi:MAG: aspartate carbamoyltransferase [Candidatus Woesearchaeota archaeon]
MNSHISQSSLQNRDILSIWELSKDEILEILQKAHECEIAHSDNLHNKIVATLFFEPSTRTRLSFESAAQRVGAKILGFSDISNTSVTKGETLSDTIRMVSSYADAIVLRHKLEGAARRASEVSTVPIINAGDGSNQHPTQTLLDLYAIYKTQGSIEQKTVALIGDLKYGRTAHSLAYALSLFSCKLVFISPKGLEMPTHICEMLDERQTQYEQVSSFPSDVSNFDILYMTRIQKERFVDEYEYNNIKHSFRIELSHTKNLKKTCKILHPLPRVDEIHTDVDNTPYAHYFQQAADGVYVRQALLLLLLGGVK